MPASLAGGADNTPAEQNQTTPTRVESGMVPVFRIAAACLVAVAVVTACRNAQPSVAGQTWQPVNEADAPDGPLPPLTVYLPGDTDPRQTQRVDLSRFLVVEVVYDACHWDSPALVGVGRDRIEVRQAELFRECLRPIPRVAWFSIPWVDLPDPVTIVDRDGGQTPLRERRRA